MAIDRFKLLDNFWKASGERPQTKDISLGGNELIVSLRELGPMEKEGFEIDPKEKARCLYVEGHISHKGLKYFVQYMKLEDGRVDWNIMPDDSFSTSALQYIRSDLTMAKFEAYLLKDILGKIRP